MTEIQMTTDEFFDKYKPVKNHYDKHASWGGCMFDTYGQEHEHVLYMRDFEPRKVWTVVEGCNGDLIVIDGYHHVNRIGYLITEVPCEEDVSICAEDEADEEDDLED